MKSAVLSNTFLKATILTLIISIICLSVVLFIILRGVSVSGAQGMTAQTPLNVRIIEGDGIYEAYNAQEQLVRYNGIVNPSSIRPYSVTMDFTGETFPSEKILKQYVSSFATAAVSDMKGFGYKNAQVHKIYMVDLNEDYSAYSMIAALKVTNEDGSEAYIPYTSFKNRAATCLYGAGAATLEELEEMYADVFNGAYTPHDPFSGGKLSDEEAAIISDLLYNNPILNAVPKDATEIFGGYEESITRDEFIYLLMSSLSKNFPRSFSVMSGSINGYAAKNTFPDTQMPYVNMAYSLGIVSGRTDGLFEPSESISRQDIAVILANTIRKLSDISAYTPEYDEPLNFGEETPEFWSYSSMVFLSQIKAANGDRLATPDRDGFFDHEAQCSKMYALTQIWLINSLFGSSKEVAAEQTILFSDIVSVDRSIIKGVFISPNDFTNNNDPGIKASFAIPVRFDTPGIHMVRVNIKSAEGKIRVVQASLTVYDGVHSIVSEADLGDEKIGLESFFADSEDLNNIKLLTSTNYFNSTKPSLGFAAVQIDNDINYVAVQVVDTTPPTAKAVTVHTVVGDPVSPEDFVTNIFDYSEVTVKFLNGEVDVFTVGEHDVSILLTDEFQNSTTVVSKLIVFIHDFPPPAFEYIPNRYFQIGSPIDLLADVKLDPACDPDAKITFDSSKLNTFEPGRYPVVYTAVDRRGNTSTTVSYVVMTNASLERVLSLSDRVLNDIIKDSMSQREKARAIFDWVRRNISYVDNGDKIDPVSGALNAFTTARGDCYTFYAVSEILLTKAGIKNIMVQRIGGTTNHYWHFVDVGDGWYHLDTTPHYTPTDTFMFDEATSVKYTANLGRLYYNYDKSLYDELDIR